MSRPLHRDTKAAYSPPWCDGGGRLCKVDSPSRASQDGSDNSLFQAASGLDYRAGSARQASTTSSNRAQPQPTFPAHFHHSLCPAGMIDYRSVCRSCLNPWGVSRFPVGPLPGYRIRRKKHALSIVRDEFRPAIPRSGCSPVSGPCDGTKRGRNQGRQWSAGIGGSRPAMQWRSFEPVRPVWPRVAWSEQW